MNWSLQVQRTESMMTLSFNGKQFQWGAGQSLLGRMESEGIVKQVFPLHGMLLC